MPKSKRDKIVSLTKVKKKSREGKGGLLKEVRECIDQYKHLFVFSTENLRSARLGEIRQHFKQNSRIFFAKNNLMAVALGKTSEDEQANELHKVSALLKGQSGLMFTNGKADEVRRFLDEHIEEEFARAGTVATADVLLPAGPVPALHGAMEPQLRKLGMPTRLENGGNAGKFN
uniref:Ribosome assembly factor mrt4 n=1 Tax=Globodera pallida TaxID=36090 RepID=A0A183CFQ8_GLOPA